jgi:asparagine synthase (glutamine-hydrolysing)
MIVCVPIKASWGIRSCPFLDKEFMDAMRINPQDKMINKEHPMEKMVRVSIEDMLPPSVAWRQKNNLVMV